MSHDLPNHYNKEKEQAEKNIANIAKDAVKRTENTIVMGALEVVVALVLITTVVENLERNKSVEQ